MRPDKKNKPYQFVDVAGHEYPLLRFGPKSRCGEIEDGVSFSHAGNKDAEGGWVISFADLEAMYNFAKSWRSSHKAGKKP